MSNSALTFSKYFLVALFVIQNVLKLTKEKHRLPILVLLSHD